MKKQLLTLAAITAATMLNAQSNITSWQLNTTGAKGKYWSMPGPTTVTLSDSSGVTRICTTSTSIYVRTKDLATYTMGPANNPNNPTGQNYTFKFPKNPSQQTGTKTTVPSGGSVGLAVNGVTLYGSRSADSYSSSSNTNVSTGDNVWHCDAWYNEGSTMDTSGNGHSDANKRYHYHANPKKLYSDPSTAHSPIIGWAIDGYPIYGPYGYSTATNSGSAIKRMTSSYQLRSITTRTTLPSGATASSAGPNVSTTFPLGMYVEDYQYVSGLGDLDDLNGRYCVTPEYPSGTYAYFLTTDNTGSPAYPYMLASYYYGVISAADAGTNVGNATIPSSGVTCITQISGISILLANNERVLAYPNPATDRITIELKDASFNQYAVTDVLGKVVSSGTINSAEQALNVEELQSGTYFIRLCDQMNNVEVIRFIKN
ncbi:MAG: YHYH protein [Bacteroidia bacterium]